MPLHPTSKLLIDTLEALPLLDSRFANIRWVNKDAAGDKSSAFSLVFRADDVVDGRPVALKFFDPALLRNQYRLDGFHRESGLLQSLLGVNRCLQLQKALAPYDLPVPMVSGVTIPCEYFAVEWLTEDIQDYFFGKVVNDPVEKLKIFNEIVLSVEMLHRHGIFHRDIKGDNFRALHVGSKRVVVAIDLGTAARFDSPYIALAYGDQVGAWTYSSPEARANLAGNRKIAPYTDVYALGCLLFELFNLDPFFRALYAANPGYDGRLIAMQALVTDRHSEQNQIAQWRAALAQFGGGVAVVAIDGRGSTVPPGIASIMNELLSRLTHFDYSNRPIRLEWVRQQIWIAIRVLSHQKAYDDRVRRQREWRRRRIAKANALRVRLSILRKP